MKCFPILLPEFFRHAFSSFAYFKVSQFWEVLFSSHAYFQERAYYRENTVHKIRDCLHFFLWLFLIPIDSVTFKCSQKNVEAKAKYGEFFMQTSNFNGFNRKMSSIFTFFTICIRNLTELGLLRLHLGLMPSSEEIFHVKIRM